jgi:excisionase family DNA binding protein
VTASGRQIHRLPDREQPPAGTSGRTGKAIPEQQAAGEEETVALRFGNLLAERVAYSVAEAAFITGLSSDLLYAQMREGKLAYLKVGRRRIITRRNLEAFLTRAAS